jgi:protein-S-isoprenylcysteine O-methyltransferase Ste14
MTSELFFGVLIPATIANIVFSRRSLFSPRAHGFFRFFAFELILILLLMNVSAWFDDPFSPLHLLSWVLLLGSIPPAVSGYLTLRRRGEPSRGQALETNLAFENTGRLITTGIYRHIRHPMYASLLMLTWGTMLKVPSWSGMLLAGSATGFLVATARAEEAENLLRFGGSYRDFMYRTRRFIPFVF